MFSSAGLVVFVAISPSCPWNIKVVTDDVEANGCDCFVKLYSKNRRMDLADGLWSSDPKVTVGGIRMW